MEAYDYFRLCAGEDGAPTKEAVELLLSPELRLALRQWYGTFAGPLNPVAEAFRQRLTALAREPLGTSSDSSA